MIEVAAVARESVILPLSKDITMRQIRKFCLG